MARKYLYQDMHGDDVLRYTEDLALFYDFAPRSRFDHVVKCLTLDFQRMAKLTPDGIVGPMTRSAMRSLKRARVRSGTNYWGAEKDIVYIDNVPYYSQRDNRYKPNSTCNVTALAIVLAYYGVKPKNPKQQLEDELFKRLNQDDALRIFRARFGHLQDYNPWNVHGMLVWLAEQYGFRDHFATNLSEEYVFEQLDKGIPLMLSGYFTSFGHILVAIGYHGSDLIVHDPYGDWSLGYRSKHNGANRVYSAPAVWQVLKRPDIWCHTIIPKTTLKSK